MTTVIKLINKVVYFYCLKLSDCEIVGVIYVCVALTDVSEVLMGTSAKERDQTDCRHKPLALAEQLGFL